MYYFCLIYQEEFSGEGIFPWRFFLFFFFFIYFTNRINSFNYVFDLRMFTGAIASQMPLRIWNLFPFLSVVYLCISWSLLSFCLPCSSSFALSIFWKIVPGNFGYSVIYYWRTRLITSAAGVGVLSPYQHLH